MTRAVRAGQQALPLLSLMASVHNTYTLSALEFVLDSFDPESLRLRGRSLRTFDCFRELSGAQIFSNPSIRRSRERLRCFLAGCFEVGKFGGDSLESRAGQRFLQTCGTPLTGSSQLASGVVASVSGFTRRCGKRHVDGLTLMPATLLQPIKNQSVVDLVAFWI